MPRVAVARVREGAGPRVRGEPAPARGLLPRARRAARTCSRRSSSCTAGRSRSSTSTTSPARCCCSREFTLPTCVIVKHANPCGVAMAATIEEAYERALASDPLSAFGMVCAVNRPVTRASSRDADRRAVRRRPATRRTTSDGAVEALARRSRSTRILVDRERRAFAAGERDYKRVPGGLLVQDRDCGRRGPRGDDRRRRIAERGALGRPALRVAGLQARLVERDRHREGSPDPRDRRGPAEPRGLRADRAREGAEVRPRPRGAVLASDAFFPSPTAPSSRSRAASRRSSSPAARSGTPRSSPPSERPAPLWSSPGRRHFRH